MTDLDRFKSLLDDVRIKYSFKDGCGFIVIEIDDSCVFQCYQNAVYIKFDEDENFVNFEGWGE